MELPESDFTPEDLESLAAFRADSESGTEGSEGEAGLLVGLARTI
jgi:hypothetical protein